MEHPSERRLLTYIILYILSHRVRIDIIRNSALKQVLILFFPALSTSLSYFYSVTVLGSTLVLFLVVSLATAYTKLNNLGSLITCLTKLARLAHIVPVALIEIKFSMLEFENFLSSSCYPVFCSSNNKIIFLKIF